jgi:chaperone BCS1
MKKIIDYVIKHPLVTTTVSSLATMALKEGVKYVVGKFTVIIECTAYEDAYGPLLKWIHTSGKLPKNKNIRFDRRADNSFALPVGKFLSTHNRKPMIIECIKKETMEDTVYSLKLTILGGTEDDLNEILNVTHVAEDRDQHVQIQSYDHGYWYRSRTKNIRKEDTFVTCPGKKERILNDIDWFYNNKAWYVNKGIPYHRGYLFYGKPGTGKTTFINVIASKFDKPLCVIHLSGVGNDEELIKCVGGAPPGAIIAFEDIDCIKVSEKRNTDNKKDSGVTLAGLLNALDGILTPENSIFILTTNDLESLDPALIRPGRIDMVEEFQYLEKAQQEELSLLFFDKKLGVNKPIAASKLQGIFMKNLDNWKGAKKEMEAL